MASSALAYRVLSKMSSKRFLRTAPSCRGQEESSWWQKTTCSKMGLLTPRKKGMFLSSSVHLWDMVTRSPVSRLTVRRVPSRALKDAVVFFCVTSILRATTMEEPSVLLKRSLMLPLTLVVPRDLGSWMKLCPALTPGGKDPVTAYLRDSMMVVLPASLWADNVRRRRRETATRETATREAAGRRETATRGGAAGEGEAAYPTAQHYSPQPLAPTMMVRGKQKPMTCSSSSGEKERMPRMESLEMEAMAAGRGEGGGRRAADDGQRSTANTSPGEAREMEASATTGRTVSDAPDAAQRGEKGEGGCEVARSTLGGHCSRDCCPRSRGLRASAMTPPKSWPPWSRPLTPRLRTWRPANVHQVSHRKGTPSNDEISDAAIVEPSACEAIQTEATKIEPSDAGDLPSTGSRRRDLRRPDHGDAFDVEGLGGDGRRRGRQRRGPWRPTSHGAETAFHGRTAAAADRQQSTQWPGEDLASGVAVRRRQLIPSEAPHLATEASRVAGVKCARRSCAHRARRHLNCTRRLPKLRTP